MSFPHTGYLGGSTARAPACAGHASSRAYAAGRPALLERRTAKHCAHSQALRAQPSIARTAKHCAHSQEMRGREPKLEAASANAQGGSMLLLRCHIDLPVHGFGISAVAGGRGAVLMGWSVPRVRVCGPCGIGEHDGRRAARERSWRGMWVCRYSHGGARCSRDLACARAWRRGRDASLGRTREPVTSNKSHVRADKLIDLVSSSFIHDHTT